MQASQELKELLTPSMVLLMSRLPKAIAIGDAMVEGW